jgi:ParB family chromosome partitioning protein
VRTAEDRARASNAGAGEEGDRRRRRTGPGEPHPDQQQAAEEIAEALGGALGAELRVKPTRDGGYRVELSFATCEEALELARRLRPRALA